MSELWRVEVGAYTTGDHYAVGPDGSWHMAGTTQDARALVAYLNGLEQRLHDAEAQRDGLLAQRKREAETWDALKNPGRLLLETTRQRDQAVAALERIAAMEWRITSGSIGPLMDMGYAMGGGQASKAATDALTALRATPAEPDGAG